MSDVINKRLQLHSPEISPVKILPEEEKQLCTCCQKNETTPRTNKCAACQQRLRKLLKRLDCKGICYFLIFNIQLHRDRVLERLLIPI